MIHLLDLGAPAATRDAASSIAVLDAAGTIVAVNAGWVRFGQANGRLDPMADIGHPYPLAGIEGAEHVIAGPESEWSCVYQGGLPGTETWYRVVVVRIDHGWPGRCIVLHRQLATAPDAGIRTPAREEPAHRWRGVYTLCARCEERTRDPLGQWVAGRPEPGLITRHGLCPACAVRLLDDPPLLTA